MNLGRSGPSWGRLFKGVVSPGFNQSFDELIDIYKKNIFPNKILFSGKKGIGKTTFAYHLINYFFSLEEDNKYNFSKNEINPLNKSFKLIQKNSHPNFFKISLKEDKKNIEIGQIREMINFTNQSSFNNKNKIILIDSVEHLNLNSVNALLKIIEEPNQKILFFLIYSNEKKIIKTLKSRCIEFKLKLDKKYVKEIVNLNFQTNIFDNISTDFKNYFSSPSLLINLINYCKENDLNIEKISIEQFIKHLITNRSYKKNNLIKNDIKYFLELFFRKRVNTNSNNDFFNLYNYFNKKFDLLQKFNLDIESYLMEFQSKLLNE